MQKTTGDIKTIKIGVFSDINGDIIYDLLFHLSLRCENGEIMEAEIIECEETTMLGTYEELRIMGKDTEEKAH